MLLLIDACVRTASRTRQIADCLMSQFDEPFTEVQLQNISFPVADESFLTKRDRLIEAGSFADPMFSLARQFASADRIVIAAPYWDLSFPASLKQYFEQINVLGITFTYSPEGIPIGLCKAKDLFYVTTAGGNFVPDTYGFGYVKALAENFYGIKNVQLIQASGLDLDGADPEQILQDCMDRIRSMTF